MDCELSLLDEVRAGGYETSIITTFNAFLPFYEEVILPRLVGAGCRNNVVLMDAGQLSAAAVVPSGAPRLSGTQYTLIPMAVPGGVFHPKLLMLLGCSKGVFACGSHNLTISGFGGNRELTTVLRWGARTGTGDAAIFREGLDLLSTWIAAQLNPGVHELGEVLSAASDAAPWLRDNVAPASSVSLIGTEPAGESLWARVRPLVGHNVQRMLCTGAFFDSSGAFLRRLEQEFGAAELIVGVEPDTVDFGPKTVEAVRRGSFVDASTIARGKGYLHAKALFFDTGGANDVLVIGSANPSSPAWLADPGHRNVECVLVQAGSSATDAARRLGLLELGSMSVLARERLREIADRAPRALDDTEDPATMVRLAMEEDGSLRLYTAADAWPADERVAAYDREGGELEVARCTVDAAGIGLVHCETETACAAHRLLWDDAQGRQVTALVHHTARLRELGRSKHQRDLRRALASLGGDCPELIDLIAAVEHIVFERDPSVRAKASGRKDSRDDQHRADELVESLVVDRTERVGRGARRRIVRSGDLGELLDALVYHLGVGLESTVAGVDRRGRSEEDLVGTDDDDRAEFEGEAEGAGADATPFDLGACQNRVRILVSRVLKQIAQATERGDAALPAMIQLFAVLALLRKLRIHERHDPRIAKNETLFLPAERYRLLDGALAVLFGRFHRLFEKAKAEAGMGCDELSRLLALLLWLAWDAGIDPDRPARLGESPEEQRERLWERARLLAVAPAVVVDPEALAEATATFDETAGERSLADSRAWLDATLRWASGVAPFVVDLKSAPVRPGAVEAGDLAFAPDATCPEIRVVLTRRGKNLVLADVDRTVRDGEVVFDRARVHVVDTSWSG